MALNSELSKLLLYFQAYSKKMEEELNIQKLVERETNQLKDRIEDLQTRMEKLRKELRKKKECENELNSEMETLKKVFLVFIIPWAFSMTFYCDFYYNLKDFF